MTDLRDRLADLFTPEERASIGEELTRVIPARIGVSAPGTTHVVICFSTLLTSSMYALCGCQHDLVVRELAAGEYATCRTCRKAASDLRVAHSVAGSMRTRNAIILAELRQFAAEGRPRDLIVPWS